MASQDISDITQARKDHAMELFIGNMLRGSVIAVVVIVVFGAILYLPSSYSLYPTYHKFVSEPSSFRTVWGILSLAASGNSRGIIEVGMLLLILTPVLRVAVSVAAFLYEKDYLYVILTLIVFGILMFSLTGGA